MRPKGKKTHNYIRVSEGYYGLIVEGKLNHVLLTWELSLREPPNGREVWSPSEAAEQVTSDPLSAEMHSLWQSFQGQAFLELNSPQSALDLACTLATDLTSDYATSSPQKKLAMLGVIQFLDDYYDRQERRACAREGLPFPCENSKLSELSVKLSDLMSLSQLSTEPMTAELALFEQSLIRLVAVIQSQIVASNSALDTIFDLERVCTLPDAHMLDTRIWPTQGIHSSLNIGNSLFSGDYASAVLMSFRSLEDSIRQQATNHGICFADKQASSGLKLIGVAIPRLYDGWIPAAVIEPLSRLYQGATLALRDGCAHSNDLSEKQALHSINLILLLKSLLPDFQIQAVMSPHELHLMSQPSYEVALQNLHPKLFQTVAPMLSQKRDGEAIMEGFKLLEHRLRAELGEQHASFTQLLKKAFTSRQDKCFLFADSAQQQGWYLLSKACLELAPFLSQYLMYCQNRSVLICLSVISVLLDNLDRQHENPRADSSPEKQTASPFMDKELCYSKAALYSGTPGAIYQEYRSIEQHLVNLHRDYLCLPQATSSGLSSQIICDLFGTPNPLLRNVHLTEKQQLTVAQVINGIFRVLRDPLAHQTSLTPQGFSMLDHIDALNLTQQLVEVLLTDPISARQRQEWHEYIEDIRLTTLHPEVYACSVRLFKEGDYSRAVECGLLAAKRVISNESNTDTDPLVSRTQQLKHESSKRFAVDVTRSTELLDSMIELNRADIGVTLCASTPPALSAIRQLAIASIVCNSLAARSSHTSYYQGVVNLTEHQTAVDRPKRRLVFESMLGDSEKMWRDFTSNFPKMAGKNFIF